ncbi:UvrD-helicase domain-containing protein [Rubrivirga marina]|uniref:DNA 3'-5' helicase n=1 Tax=Rubrivirga marina TaxID=1196024 RepID=A0A271IYX9_9BACT|nr:UvrD-helicase domain-containing protein [Rubrivirga marina]PAP76287.1 hypothetical protein BSZ37_07420 [Rubrivirga marina]
MSQGFLFDDDPSDAPVRLGEPAGGDGAASAPPDDVPRRAEAVPPFEYWATPVEPGRTLVEASAGTGKTFAIAGLVLRLVLEGEWLGEAPDLRRLLVVTFTKAATEELRTRIRAALRAALAVARGHAEPDDLTRPLEPLLTRPDAPGRLLAALDRVDEAGIFTIHGFCKRVLQQAAFESGTPFDMEFVEDADSDALRTRAAADAWARLVHGDPLLTATALHFSRPGKDPLATKTALPAGRTPDALKKYHADTADFPSVRIVPGSLGLGDAVERLRTAQAALAAVWDADAARDALDGIDWNKAAPLGGSDADRLLASVGAFARGDDPDGLGAALACAPDAIGAAATTRSTAQKEAVAEAKQYAGFQACAEVAEAANALDLAFVRAFVLEVDERIRAIKERRGQLTFADLITRLHDALADPATGPTLAQGIRGQFSVALIDEFQDTDPLQYAIFRTAFEGRPLYFVGDPKQAIYAFRGADVHAYLGAQREADRRFTLGTNWRSTAGLVEAVNRVFEGPERAFLFDGIPFRRVASSPAKKESTLVDGDLPPFVWWETPTTDKGKALGKGALNEAIPPLVAAEIARLLGSARLGGRPVREADIAVLVPTRYEAADVLAALQRLRIPAVVSRANDVRESVVMAEVEFVLRAVLRPDDERARRAALATELWGWTAHDIAALDADPDREARIAAGLRDAQRLWRRSGVLGVLVAFQEREGVLERLLARPDGERRVTDLRHAAELLHEVETAGAKSPEDLMHWLRNRADQALPSREMKELRLERDADAVTITTHHNSKGLEYEIVFAPYLWSLSERDYKLQTPALARTPDGVVYDLGSDDLVAHDKLRQADALAEAVRKAYVVLTRARERCYVVWGEAGYGQWRLDHRSALGYLLAGHAAPAGDLVSYVDAARAEAANVRDWAAVVRDLDPEGRVMRVVEPPTPASTDARTEAADEIASAGGAAVLPDHARDRIGSPWTRASFTAWTSGHAGALAASDEPGTAEARTEAEPVGIHAFAAGAGPGTCLHEILQHAHWGDDQRAQEANRETVAKHLRQHGLDRPRAHRIRLDAAAEVEALVERVATAPLFGAGRLRTCEADDLVAEWDFTVPLAPVAPAHLAAAFREHGQEPFAAAYADDLARLSADAVDGYLTGSADLVARVDGRWWIVDWKSNRLGTDASAYTSEALAVTMREHHYGLQLHLYTLGLHRFLRSRLGAAYAYDDLMGGATYAFLRGLSAPDSARLGAEAEGGDEVESTAGLFTHRPSAALIDALDRLLLPDA